MAGLVVTGTDTEVGKTAVSCALCAALVARGHDVRALKPVVTGLDEPGPHDHQLLAAITGQAPAEVAPERFGPAVSPHLAMAQAGRQVDAHALAGQARAWAAEGTVVVEGAGGLLAPFDAARSFRDVAGVIGLPVVVAARAGLGTINHTLLTVEAARSAGLDVRAVVLTPWPDAPDVIAASNRDHLTEQLGTRTSVATLRHVDVRSPEALAEASVDWPLERWLAPAQPDVALDHVVLAVSDWERSNAFYEEVCRAELVRLDHPPPTRWRYRFGGVQMNVHGPGMEPAPEARIPAAPGSADICLIWPGTAEEAAAHLRRHGVAVEDGPVWRNGARGPGRSVYFRDPDGSLLEFIAYG